MNNICIIGHCTSVHAIIWPWAYYYMGLTLWSHRFTFMFGFGSNDCFVTSAPCMIGVTVMALLVA